MNSLEAYALLRGAGVPVVETGEAAALFRQTKPAASHTLARLAEAGLVTRVRSGTWWIDGPVQRERLARFLRESSQALSIQLKASKWTLHEIGLVGRRLEEALSIVT